MGALAPSGEVYQAGTLSGNPLAMAAGLAVLQSVTDAAYEALADRGSDARRRTRAGAGGRRDRRGGAARRHAGRRVRGRRRRAAHRPKGRGRGAGDQRPGPVRRALPRPAARGVAFAPGAYEVLFCSLAHDDAAIARTLDVVHEAAVGMVAGWLPESLVATKVTLVPAPGVGPPGGRPRAADRPQRHHPARRRAVLGVADPVDRVSRRPHVARRRRRPYRAQLRRTPLPLGGAGRRRDRGRRGGRPHAAGARRREADGRGRSRGGRRRR